MFCGLTHTKWTDCPQHWDNVGTKGPYAGRKTDGVFHCLNCNSTDHTTMNCPAEPKQTWHKCGGRLWQIKNRAKATQHQNRLTKLNQSKANKPKSSWTKVGKGNNMPKNRRAWGSDASSTSSDGDTDGSYETEADDDGHQHQHHTKVVNTCTKSDKLDSVLL